MRPWSRFTDWANLLAGIWMIISPWALLFAGNSSASVNAWVVGALIFLFALWALNSPLRQLPEWGNTVLGVWTFISPWALGFAFGLPAAAWSAWVIGFVVFWLAVLTLPRTRPVL